MFILRLTGTGSSDRREELIAELAEAGTAGVLESDLPGGVWQLEAWFDDAEVAAQFGVPVEPAPDRDWVAESRAAWHERLVGDRFFLVPAWSDIPTPEGRLRLEYQPGTACGTGEHPATRLALTALEKVIHDGDRVLDVGTGSGILVLAAKLLGAETVVGCDIDPADVAVAKENTPGAFFIGSARAVQAAWADVVVANINAAVLKTLLPDLKRVLRPGGRLVLSGFRPGELQGGEELQLEGFAALIC